MYDKNNLILPDLSYQIVGICYQIHNDIGRYSREKQYCDRLEVAFLEKGISYLREYTVKDTGNRIDFLIEDKIVLEVKATDHISRDHYYQVQRYLFATQSQLGLIVNFRSRTLRPKRVVKALPFKEKDHS